MVFYISCMDEFIKPDSCLLKALTSFFWGGDNIQTSQKTTKVEYIRSRMEKPDWKLAEELDETLYYVWLVKEVKRNPKLQRKRGHIKR